MERDHRGGGESVSRRRLAVLRRRIGVLGWLLGIGTRFVDHTGSESSIPDDAKDLLQRECGVAVDGQVFIGDDYLRHADVAVEIDENGSRKKSTKGTVR